MKCGHMGPTMLHLNLFIYILQVYSKILNFFTLKFKCKEKRSEHISPKSLVCLYLHLTISLSFHHPPPFILIFLLATNLFAIFIFHAVCYSVTSAQLRLWTAAQTQILLCLTPPQKKKSDLLFICLFLCQALTHTANHQPQSSLSGIGSFSSCNMVH